MPSSISSPARDAIIARARAEGFDAIGIVRAEKSPLASENLKKFLSLKYHGEMAWMESTAERRADATTLWPQVKSILTLGVSYAPTQNPLDMLERKDRGAISVYAQGRDYHDVLKNRLKKLAGWIATEHGGDVKIFVDTAPVMEKPLAQSGGLGWQGKHTNLVSREFGSWLFLGTVFTTLELDADEREEDHCGSCSACVDICPTNAFPAPYTIDARRCISYLTIENKDHIPPEFRAAMGNRIYGCDDCLSACPWNKFAGASRDMAFAPRAELTAPRLADLAMMSDADFREVFSGSPIKRIGRDRFVRNVLIALGNARDVSLAPVALGLLDDPSPLVRAAAIWALKTLLPQTDFVSLSEKKRTLEADETVRAEWA